jgi:hypothetical protein
VLIIQVDVIQAETLKGTIAALPYVLWPPIDARPAAVRCPHVAELRGQHDLAAPVPDRLAHEDLVLAYAVHVGRVQEIDPQFQRAVDCGDGLGLVAGAVELAHAHAAQAQGRNGQSLSAKTPLFHKTLLIVGSFA